MFIRNSSRLQFQEAIPKIAQLLSEKTGIRIRQYGDQAVCKYDESGENVAEIVVPMIPENADNHLFTMVSGFLDHECAHALYTDGTSYNRLTKNGHKVPFDLVNMIEDCRIEKLMGKRYPGSKMNLEYVNENVTKDHIVGMQIAMSAGGDIPLGKISAICLHVCMGKAMGHTCFEQIISYISKNYPENFEQINKIVTEETEALNSLKNTDDTVLEAERIYNRIVNEVLDQPDLDSDAENKAAGKKGKKSNGKKKVKIVDIDLDGDNKDKSEDGEESDSDTVLASSKPNEKGKNDDKNEDKEKVDADKGEKSDEKGEDKDESGAAGDAENEERGRDDHSEEENDDQIDVTITMTNKEDFSRMLGEFNRETNVTKIINKLVSNKGDTPETYLPYTTEFDYFGPAKYDQGLSETIKTATLNYIENKTGQYVGTMAKDVERYISAKSLSYRVGGTRRGKLCAANLSRLAVGDDRVFSKRVENRTKDVAVELLVDFSGSMSGRKIYLAMLSAFALADTLGMCGIKTQVRGFTTRSSSTSRDLSKLYGEMCDYYYNDELNFSRYEALNCPVVKTFDENLRSSAVRLRFASIFYDLSYDMRLKVANETGTIRHNRNYDLELQNNIDGECVQFAARELLARKEKGKILIVVSDGYPCANMRGDLASQHLRKVVQEIEKSEIKIAGIGVMDDAVKRFYTNNATIYHIEDLPKALLEQVRKFI